MARVIKFRALKDDMSNCNFVYGELVYDAIGNPRITHKDFSGKGLKFNSCLKGTEGQFTGLLDKNGKEIYEGDCLGGSYEGGFIKYCETCIGFQYHLPEFGCTACEGDVLWYELVQSSKDKEIEVVGNIHENPELLNQTRPQG